MAATACSLNKLKPCVFCIFVNIKFTVDFMDALTSNVFFYFTLFFVFFVRNCTFFFILSYDFPVNVGYKQAIQFPAFSLVGHLYVCDVSSTISVSFKITYVSFTSASLYLEPFMSSILFDIWLSISSEIFMMSSTLSFLSGIFTSPTLSPMILISVM